MKPFHFILRFGVFAAAALGIAGCHAQEIDASANAQIAAIREHTSESMMYPSCNDGAPIGPTCGLIVQRVAMPDFQMTFAEKKCAGDTEERCDAKLGRAIEAWLVQRYPLARFQAVAVTCDANPGRCDDPKQRELMLLDSQNAAVRELDAGHEFDVESERQVQHTIDRQNAEQAAFVALLALDIAASHHHHHHH
jgi:hypothetical protein